MGRRALAAVVVSGLLVACGREDASTSEATAIAPGVTDEPCAEAVDDSRGCLYLGAITDLTGPFAAVSGPLLEGAQAFWADVNAAGGVDGHEVDLTTYVRDNTYDPDVHARMYAEIDDHVLAMAQSLGGPATRAMLADPDAESLVVVPLTQSSDWLFEPRVLETGTSYCVDAMNAVDHELEAGGVDDVLALHFPGDYGDDSVRGAELAATGGDAGFTDVVVEPGTNQQAAVSAVLDQDPDVVLVSTGPSELAAIVGQAVAQGYDGRFVASLPAWNAALLETPAADALEERVLWAHSFPGYAADTPGSERMRASAGDAAPNEWYAIGWTAQYALLAALEAAADDGDLTREGLLAAASSLESVDFEGTLPDGFGAYGAPAAEAALRTTNFFRPDRTAEVGVVPVDEAYTGPTAAGYDFAEACYSS